MINRTHILTTIAAIVIIAALGMKFARYFPPSGNESVSAIDSLDDVFAKSGWTREKSATNEPVSALKIYQFKHQSCSSTLSVAILGTTSGLELLVRERMGDSVAFYQNGHQVEKLNRMKNQFETSKKGIRTLLGVPPHPALPIFAVSPKPNTLKPECTKPVFTLNQQVTS